MEWIRNWMSHSLTLQSPYDKLYNQNLLPVLMEHSGIFFLFEGKKISLNAWSISYEVEIVRIDARKNKNVDYFWMQSIRLGRQIFPYHWYWIWILNESMVVTRTLGSALISDRETIVVEMNTSICGILHNGSRWKYYTMVTNGIES